MKGQTSHPQSLLYTLLKSHGQFLALCFLCLHMFPGSYFTTENCKHVHPCLMFYIHSQSSFKGNYFIGLHCLFRSLFLMLHYGLVMCVFFYWVCLIGMNIFCRNTADFANLVDKR